MATAIRVLPSLTDSPPISLIHYPSLIDQPTLADLDQLVRVKDYFAQRDSASRIQLHQIILANALIARLVWALYHARGVLVELLSADDAPAYATFNQSVESLQKSIQNTCSPVTDSSIIPRFDYTSKENLDSTPRTFLDDLSPTAASTIVAFVENVRNDSSVLSKCLSSAYPHELDALVRWIPHHLRSKSDPEKSISNHWQSENLMSFHRHDPLYVLTRVIFAPPSSDFSTTEDLRRLHVWSTVFAQMVTDRKGEKFCLAILDTWVGLAEWTGASRFEQALFVILQDGATLLSTRTDDADIHVRRGSELRDTESESSDSSNDADAINTFFDSAILRLLIVLDGEGGLPFGAVRLGQAAFSKLAKEDVQYFESFVVSKWLFYKFLKKAVIHPENYGLFGDYHLTDDQRDQLLKPLHNRLYYAASSVISGHHVSSSRYEALVQAHVKSIMEKLCGISESMSTDSLRHDPTDINSKIQSTIVLCPSDILTSFYALYPQFKPDAGIPVAHGATVLGHTRHSSNDSTFSQKSEIIRYSTESLRPAVKRQRPGDTISMAGSYSSQSERSSQSAIVIPYEPEERDGDVYGLAVKAAIDEMLRRLGSDCAGDCHPCEERWAPIYVSADGCRLSLQPDFDMVIGTNGVTAEPVEMVVNRDIDAMVESSIISLLQESPRSALLSSSNKISDLPDSLNYSRHALPLSDENLIMLPPRGPVTSVRKSPVTSPFVSSPLLDALMRASTRCYTRGQFVQSQKYMHCVQVMKEIKSPNLTKNDYASVLGIIARRMQGRSNVHLNHVRAQEVWFSYALEERDILHRVWDDEKVHLSRLRCKLWYIDFVRETSHWERAKGVCSALERMRNSNCGSISPSPPVLELRRNSSILSLQLAQRNSASRSDSPRFQSTRNSIEGQSFRARPVSLYNVSISDDWFDILAAPEEQGGPHKLSDVQVDVTKKWLQQNGVQNFCHGEELIHRFVAEIDDLIRRAIPDSALDVTPVSTAFWENQMFSEDAKALNMAADPSPSTARGKNVQFSIGRKSAELPRSPGVDNSGIKGKTRSKTMSGEVAPPEPRFLCASCGKTTSVIRKDAPKRPGLSHSLSFPTPFTALSLKSNLANTPSNMVHPTNRNNIKAVDEFLDKVRAQITSLALSDLGGSIWATGSETDEWFSRRVGDEWLASSLGDKSHSNGFLSKDRGTEKKKMSQVLPNEFKASAEASRLATHQSQTARLVETWNLPIKLTAEIDRSSRKFPFQESYQYLMERLSVHPSPQHKLQALFEMESLLEAENSQQLRETLKMELQTSTAPMILDPSIVVSRLSGDSVETTSSQRSTFGTDDLIGHIQSILRNSHIGSKTLFRDLTFVASFVPAITLTHAGQGKVFWDFGAAALSLKTDLAKAMAQWYDEIMHGKRKEMEELRTRAHGRTRSQGVVMEEAARMLVIAAREGIAIAQRELALLHLSEPSILTLSSMPLSQPSDTFHSVYCNKESFANKDKYDPYRIALAKHWMGLAAEAGDSYALSAINDDYFGSL